MHLNIENKHKNETNFQANPTKQILQYIYKFVAKEKF